AVNELDANAEWLEDELNGNEVCFDSPFWIDKYEVTNEQYGSTGCEEESDEPDQPRNCVDWFEALAHCQARGATLPTEAQWEYAAGGPDSLTYPWGNNYIAENVIGEDDPTYGDSETAPVGSRLGGASWVGALDMSGNLWEWTVSEYVDYPYDANDGRNDNLESTDVLRVLRGGSFFNASNNLRSADRYGDFPAFDFFDFGFRCVRSYQQ
ncbi:MAG: formylglycine-generating enzyme family protein, partial [Chloroflexota bacterium]